MVLNSHLECFVLGNSQRSLFPHSSVLRPCKPPVPMHVNMSVCVILIQFMFRQFMVVGSDIPRRNSFTANSLFLLRTYIHTYIIHTYMHALFHMLTLGLRVELLGLGSLTLNSYWLYYLSIAKRSFLDEG